MLPLTTFIQLKKVITVITAVKDTGSDHQSIMATVIDQKISNIYKGN